MCNLYVGSKLQINGRQYEITDFSYEFTRNAFTQKMQHTFGMINSGFSQKLGDFLDSIYLSGLLVSQFQFGFISRISCAGITSGPIIALDIVDANSISKWRQLSAEKYCSGSPSATTRELNHIFDQRRIELKSQIDGTVRHQASCREGLLFWKDHQSNWRRSVSSRRRISSKCTEALSTATSTFSRPSDRTCFGPRAAQGECGWVTSRGLRSGGRRIQSAPFTASTASKMLSIAQT